MGIKLLSCKNCLPTRQKNCHWKNWFACPPKEANNNKILKLRKCILADASQHWCLKLKELIKLGAKPSQLDQGVFIWSISNKLVGILVWFADSMLWKGKKKTLLALLTNRNKPSTLVQSIVKPSINTGIYLKQNNNFSITINQVDYINSINEIKVNNILKKNKNDKLTEKEITYWEEL